MLLRSALICVMICTSGCEPSKPEPTMRERFEATEKLLSVWDKDIKGSRADYIRILISEGADVNAKDKDGFTPLMMAAINETPETVRFLIDRGAEVNAKCQLGHNALFYARAHLFFFPDDPHTKEYKRRSETAKVLKAAGAKE